MKNLIRKTLRKRRHQRIRQRVHGTGARPRFSVYRSEKHIHIQIIDDTTTSTLVSASSLEDGKMSGSKKTVSKKEMKEKESDKSASDSGRMIRIAKAAGTLAAKRALEKGISQVAFDRGGFRFHGRVKAVAEGAREAGLQF